MKMSHKTHFPPSDWVDFLRGSMPAREQAEMKSHIDRGCEECVSSSQFWRKVEQFANDERLNAPPEDAVRIVKASFSSASTGERSSLGSMLAQLIFDSAAQPAMAGLRSAATTGPRRLLFRSGDHSVDLSVETLSNSKQMFIGQVLDSSASIPEMSGVKVSLIWNDGVLATAQTDDAGLFSLEAERECDLEVVFKIDEENREVLLLSTSRKARSQE